MIGTMPLARATARVTSAALDDRPSVCVLALSPIADDPRARRQAEAFHRAGWRVVAVGLPGAHSPEPEWRIVTCEAPQLCRGPKTAPLGAAVPAPLLRHIRPSRIWYAAYLLGVRFRPELAQRLYWTLSSFSTQLHAMYARASRVEAAVWLANDWTTLPLAARLAREKGGVYGYDTHEFAREEYAERRRWRFWHRPMVCALEGSLIGGAAVVSAVSGGIAEQLDKVYRLTRGSLVIRNTPAFETAAFSPTGATVRVLYHGIVTPGRGLEAAIDSVALWPADFELTIRGPGEAAYLETLRRRISEGSAAGRVHLAPPVPMTALVREAAFFDVGFFALPGTSRHNRFALPNKLFEYVMAGLAVCVTDLPEMARLVRQYDLGVLIPSVDPAAIAEAIGRLDRERIDHHKRRALAAARELCWERESQRLIDAYSAALQASAG